MRVAPHLLFAVLLVAPSVRAATAEECASTAEHASDLRDGGKLREAWTGFEACARDECPSIVRSDCRAALADLREHGPHVSVRVRDARGADLESAFVTIDGEELSADGRIHGVLLDPGAHVVRASLAGFDEQQQTIVVTMGEPSRSVEMTLTAHDQPATPVVVAPRRDRTAAIVVGSIGVAAFATFAVVGTWTYVGYRNDRDGCSPSCSASDVDSLRTRAHVADVALGIGIVAAVTATVLWLTAPTTDAPPSGKEMAWISW